MPSNPTSLPGFGRALTVALAALAVLPLIVSYGSNGSGSDETSTLDAHNQITTLVSRLGAALDERDFEQIRQICSEDVTLETPGGKSAGHEAVIAQADRIHARHQRTQHVLTDIIVDVQRDKAEIRANSVATFVPADMSVRPPAPLFRIGEVYRFQAKRTNQGWRLSRVASAPVWGEGAVPTGMTGR